MSFSMDDITTGQNIEPPRIILYGVPGIGKTTFASESPSPIFVPTEKGQGRLSLATFPLCQSFDDVENALTLLYHESHEFQTVVIDALDGLERLIFEAVCEGQHKKSIGDFDYGKGYVLALDTWQRCLALIERLRDEKGMLTIMIGHSTEKTFNNPEGENYDRFQLQVHKHAAQLLLSWCDALLFTNYKIQVKAPMAKLGKELAPGKVKAKPTAGVEAPRTLYTTEHPAFWAKNRYNLPESLPLEWQAFDEAMSVGIETFAETIEEKKKG
jgi:hypothetical protein